MSNLFSLKRIFLWISSAIITINSISIVERDEIICNFLRSTNIAKLRDELGWTGWECDGNVAIDLCGHKFWTAIMCRGDNITQLLFEHKSVTGTIPSEFSRLNDLVWIDFTANNITGTIPESFGSLTNLVEITLGENKIKGTIPSSLGNLNGLLNLELSETLITGTLPSSLGQLTNLMYLQISQTSLGGSIPETFGSLSNLDSLELTHNSLTGSIPTSFNSLHKLEKLHLHNNILTSSLPFNVSGLSSLRTLTLENNQLTGTLSLSFLSLKKLHLIRLQNNLNISSTNIEELCEDMHSIEIIEVIDGVNACFHPEDPIVIDPGPDPTWHQPNSSIFPLLIVVGGVLFIVCLVGLDQHCREKKDFIEFADDIVGTDEELAGGGAGGSGGASGARSRPPTITRNPLTSTALPSSSSSAARPTTTTSSSSLPFSPSHSYSRTLMYADDDDEEDLQIALQELNSRRAERSSVEGTISSLAYQPENKNKNSPQISEVELGLKMSLQAVVDRSRDDDNNPPADSQQAY